MQVYAKPWSLQNRCLTETDDQPCPIVNGGNAQKSGFGLGRKMGERRQFWQLLLSLVDVRPLRGLERKEGGWAGRSKLSPFFTGLGSREGQQQISPQRASRMDGRTDACGEECASWVA